MMIDMDPDVLKVFGFWGSILILKMLAMTPLTARQRFKKMVFANPEDIKGFEKGAKMIYNDPDVERVRRAHLNDLENILPWFLATYLWLGTGPSPWLAKTLIRSFVLSRILYTISYAFMAQQPTRAVVFFVGYGITGYQVFSTLLYYS